jgi:hypothetical protein
MKVNRENKKMHNVYLSIGCLAMIKAMSIEDGCSESEIVSLAVHYYQQYRNMLITLSGMQKESMTIMGESLKREIGVYQVTVEKCQEFFDKPLVDYKRDKVGIRHLMETCNYHLDHDLCTSEERNTFTKFVDWAVEKLEQIKKEGE